MEKLQNQKPGSVPSKVSNFEYIKNWLEFYLIDRFPTFQLLLVTSQKVGKSGHVHYDLGAVEVEIYTYPWSLNGTALLNF